jgi:hypothetical protein
MTNEEKKNLLITKNKEALLGGGKDKVDKHHKLQESDWHYF